MAPIKFEDNIREKLQERELQPSQEAWKKLSGQLDEQMPQRKKTPFLWMAVAASIVGMIIVTTFLFQSEDVSTPLVKEEPTESYPKEDLLKEPENIVEGTQDEGQLKVIPIESELASNDADADTETKFKISQDKSGEKTFIEKENKIQQKQAVVVSSTLEKIPLNEAQEHQDDAFINMKVEEVVAEVQSLQQSNNTVTTDEIDALLAKAQRDISNQRMLQDNTQRIDASALLLDVELELEQSFREKVFQVLGEGFNKIRTAVSERNN